MRFKARKYGKIKRFPFNLEKKRLLCCIKNDILNRSSINYKPHKRKNQ